MDSPKTVREAIERLGWKPEQDSDAFIREALTELIISREFIGGESFKYDANKHALVWEHGSVCNCYLCAAERKASTNG